MAEGVEGVCRVAVVVTDPVRGDVLIVRPARASAAADTDWSWTLPWTTVADDADTTTTLQAIDALLGVRAVPLRIATLAARDHEHASLVLAEIEPTATAFVGEWVASDALDVDAGDPAIAPTLRAWLARRAAPPTARTQPWSQPGWFAEAARWLREAIERAGLEPSGEPTMHYLWALTAILRAPTTSGAVFLKACSSIFPQEVALTALLGTRTPGLVTTVIEADRTRSWLLMADLGGDVLAETPPAGWPAAMATHASIQRTWADHLDELRVAGAPDRSLEVLAEAANTLSDDAGLMATLTPEERDVWAAAAPRLVAACRRLAVIAPVLSVLHGDLHLWNVVRRPDGYVVFDWSDAAVGHPFLDLVPFVLRISDLDVRRAARDAYVAGWAGTFPGDALQEAAALALPVGCLNQVVSYRKIFAAMDPDDISDLHGADVDWLQRTLVVLEHGIDAVWPD